jgi:hypothetical protein
MTAQPNAHVRFRRAIERRALWMAEDAARDLPNLPTGRRHGDGESCGARVAGDGLASPHPRAARGLTVTPCMPRSHDLHGFVAIGRIEPRLATRIWLETTCQAGQRGPEITDGAGLGAGLEFVATSAPPAYAVRQRVKEW